MWKLPCTDFMCPMPLVEIFEVDVCHVFPQGVLADITFVWSGLGDGWTRPGNVCEEELPLCSVAITALLGMGTDPKLLE